MKEGKKKPCYGRATKQEVVRQYERSSASARELAGLHGIFGSNTLSNWQRKYGHSSLKKPMDMSQQTETATDGVEKRRRRYEQERISELEQELELARLRVRLYACALEVAGEEMGVDLLKKIGGWLYAGRTSEDWPASTKRASYWDTANRPITRAAATSEGGHKMRNK